MVSKEPVTAKQARLIGLMQASSLRISGLIDNVLDFARGQLGEGLTLTRNATTCQTARNIAPRSASNLDPSMG